MPSYKQEENGTWTLRYRIDGKEKKRRGFAKKTDAQKAYREIERKLEDNEYYDSTMTVEQFMAKWLEDKKNNENTRYNTYRMYEYINRLYITPKIGRLQLGKLGPLNIKDMLDKCRKERPDLSSTTLNRIHATIRSALSKAIEWELITRNPASAITPPPNRDFEPEPYTGEELFSLFNALQSESILLPVLISSLSGLRCGEVCALRWQDIELDKNLINVKHTMIRIKGQGLCLAPTKTKKSKSQVSIPEELTDILRKHKTEQSESYLKIGHALSGRDFVCAWHDLRPFDPLWVSKKFSDILYKILLGDELTSIKQDKTITASVKKEKIKELKNSVKYEKKRFHDLRHTFCTLLLESGIDKRIVQEMARHSDSRVTDRYTHVSTTLQENAAKKLSDKVFRSGHKMATIIPMIKQN